MNQYLRPSRFRTVLATALLVSLVQVEIAWATITSPAPSLSIKPPPGQPKPPPVLPLTRPKPSTSRPIYVIKMHGTVGNFLGETSKIFTAEGLKTSLDAAKRDNASVVVLDISGPGGQFLEMQKMVNVLLDAQAHGMRIVALPQDAFDAWAIVTLSCKEILVTPTSRMGSAGAITNNGNGFIEATNGNVAGSQKFTTAFETLWRQITDVTGRSPLIANAMLIQACELWFSPTKGFSEKTELDTDRQQLDDGVHVLCLNGAEMLKTKIAVGEVTNLNELPAILHSHERINTYQTPGTSELEEEAFYYVLKSHVASHWSICGGEWDTGTWFLSLLNLRGILVTKVPDPRSPFIQMAEVSCIVSREELSPADKLNSIEWIGMVKFHAEATRKYMDGSGWQAWENLDVVHKEFIVYKILKINGKWETAFEKNGFDNKSILNSGSAPDCESIPTAKAPFTSQTSDQKPNHVIPIAPLEVDPKPESKSADTSIVEVPQSRWRNGRPLAGKNLNVRTVRPVFDELTTIPSGLTNPIVEIEFDKDGVPKNCVILQSSGSELIDQPIIECMYRWRASGSQLTDLPDGKTLNYRIRMLLTK